MNKFANHLNKKFTVLSIEHPMENAAFRYVCILFCMLLLTYVYFVSASVLNVIAQREAGKTAQRLEGAIGTLELQYFALSHEVTPQNAAELGLVPIAKTAYVYRPGSVGVAPISRNAI